MKKTFVDVMLELPVDATLRDFLTTHSLPVPDGFAWDDTPETSQFLVEAVKVWPDIAARDRMTANLMASVQLGDAAGKQAMFEAAVADGAALAGLALCASDIHRSFWLYVHHPALFERAYDFSFWEQHGQQTQQYDLGLKRQPNGSDANLTALRHAISAFYKRELQCGDGSVAHSGVRHTHCQLWCFGVIDHLALTRSGGNQTGQEGLGELLMIRSSHGVHLSIFGLAPG